MNIGLPVKLVGLPQLSDQLIRMDWFESQNFSVDIYDRASGQERY